MMMMIPLKNDKVFYFYCRRNCNFLFYIIDLILLQLSLEKVKFSFFFNPQIIIENSIFFLLSTWIHLVVGRHLKTLKFYFLLSVKLLLMSFWWARNIDFPSFFCRFSVFFFLCRERRFIKTEKEITTKDT